MSTFNNVREHKDLARRFRQASITCQETKEEDLSHTAIVNDNRSLELLKFGYYICDADSAEEAAHDLETFMKARDTREFYSLILAQFPEDPIFCLVLVGEYMQQGMKHWEDEELQQSFKEWLIPDIKF